MKIIMPLAGKGSRFFNSSYKLPKPLIVVSGKPMFLKSLESISEIDYSKIYFIVRKDHEFNYNISSIIKKNIPNSIVTLVDKVPNGQLMSVLSIEKDINKDEDLLIISSDTVVISNIKNEIAGLKKNYKGMISVINKDGDQWSFVKTNKQGEIIQVAEKKRISNLASTGIYYFKNGKEFIKSAKNIIKKNIKINNEYYIMPVYQDYINNKFKIGLSIATEMWDLGNPESLKKFLKKNNG